MADKYVPINGQVYSTNIDGKAVAASRVYDDANEQFLNETIAEIKDKGEEFGPYLSVGAAHSALAAKGLNKVGTTVGISPDNINVTEYWYQGGTAQANLVQKQNAPDEEDLTSVNVGGTDVLKFKDKVYNSLTYSGMGRKILRKNIIDGANILTQDMLSDANTIYVIQYDYDIMGIISDTTTNSLVIGSDYYSYKPITIEDNKTYRALNDCVFIDYRHNSLIGPVLVTSEYESQDFAIAKKSSAASGVSVSYYKPEGTINIPANCVLQFEGGSIKNGIIVGNNTAIDAVPVKIFNTDISLEGTWNIKECYPEWWGAKGDDTTDDTAAFTALAAFVTAIDGGRVFISKKTYLITAAIYFKGNLEFCGVGADSILHLGNSNTGIHFGEVNDYTLLDSYLTDGDGTITGKTINDDEVTCKSTVKGDRIIKVSNASAFVVNELYVIQDTCDFSFDNTRAYYRQGEIIKIKSVDTTNNTITLYNGLYGIYGNDDNFEGYVEREDRNLFEQRFITCIPDITHRTVFYKYNYKQVNLHNFKIYSEGDNTVTADGYYSLYVNNVIHSKIDSIEVTSEGGSHVSFRLGGAYKSSVFNSKFYTDVTTDTDLYGASFGDIQDVLISNCTFGGRAHSLATGSKSSAGAIVNRNFIYEHLSFDSIHEPENAIILDVHAGAEYYTYKNINFPSGACDLGGYNMTVENCIFRFISSSFFRSGLTVRNTECLAIGSLLLFSNPWHDYSNDEIIIEGCKLKGGHKYGSYSGSTHSLTFTSQGSTGVYPINNLIIRNSIIEYGVYIRYKLANTIIIENNIVSLKNNMTGIVIADRRNDNNNNYIIIRNNKIIQNFEHECISIGYNTNTDTGVTEIAGNLTIENNYIQSNVYAEKAIAIGCIYNGVIKGNQIIVKSKAITIIDANCGFYNNIITSNNTSLAYYIEAEARNGYYYNIDFDDSNIINKKIVNLSNYQTNKYRVHYHNSSVRDNMNLFPDDYGYEFFDTDLKKTVKVNFTDKAKIKQESFPTGDAANGIFVPNDLVDGAIYRVGLTRKSDFYLAKTNVNPTVDDLKPIFISTNSAWGYRLFKNEASEYPYLYFVNTRGDAGDTAQYMILEQDVWKEEDGASAGVKRSGATTDRPTGTSIYIGFKYIDTTLGKPIYASYIYGDTVTWVEEDGVIAGTPTSGTFANKPTVAANKIPVGFKYFCTDKQTTEGATDGIEIIHKGSNVWVDALGRVVS